MKLIRIFVREFRVIHFKSCYRKLREMLCSLRNSKAHLIIYSMLIWLSSFYLRMDHCLAQDEEELLANLLAAEIMSDF